MATYMILKGQGRVTAIFGCKCR